MQVKKLLVLACVVTLCPMSRALPPVAGPESYSVNADETLTVEAPGVLANDADPENQTFGLRAIPSKTFGYAGVTFEQALTPNLIQKLAPGTYSGAIITAEPANPGAAQNAPLFPDFNFEFLGTLSLGKIIRNSSTPDVAQILNLPLGNDGTTARSGFELSWAWDYRLPNLAGDDFVIFESGTVNTPEGMIVQVRQTLSGEWSPWIYVAAQSFALYGETGTDGAFATTYNLDDFGVPAGATIDTIRVANMTDEDRMLNSSGQGVVIPEDNGATSNFLADAGMKANFDNFASADLDPDPMYVGVLHTLAAPIQPVDGVSALGATVVMNTDGGFTYNGSAVPALVTLPIGQYVVDTFYYRVSDTVHGAGAGLVSITVAGIAPRLRLVGSAPDQELRWEATATGFDLEFVQDLPASEWFPINESPQIDGDDKVVPVDTSSGHRYYRLIKTSGN